MTWLMGLSKPLVPEDILHSTKPVPACYKRDLFRMCWVKRQG